MEIEKEVLTKEIAQELKQIKGKARGIHFKNDAEYIYSNWGKEGLKKVEVELTKVGCPIDGEKISEDSSTPTIRRSGLLLHLEINRRECFSTSQGILKSLLKF